MSHNGVTLSVEELIEYCRTQAGLLSGCVEMIGAETDELLDEIDEDIAEIRTRLAEHATGAKRPTASPTTVGPTRPGGEILELEELETELEEKQAIAEAKQARMAAFQDLAAAYIELAEELESTVDDSQKALDRVVRFERDHHAPTYFDDRRTVLEAVTDADRPSDE